MATGESAFLSKLKKFDFLATADLAGLAELEVRSRTFPANTEIVHEHQAGGRAFIVQAGWACAYKLLPDGGRQVIDFPLPGDFMGVRSLLLRTSDHGFSAVTDLVAAEITAPRLMDLFQKAPRLGCAILWACSRDEAMVVEHLVGVGRRSAIARTAHFFVELALRLKLVGLADDTGFACPLNQYLLSDALGLTAVHLNRVLRQLRERRLMTLREGRVILHDLAGLGRLAGYDSAYLD